MKHTLKTLFLLTLAALTLLCATACDGKAPAETSAAPTATVTATAAVSPLWQTATYQEDQTLGDGNTTVSVEVQAEDKTVTFTLKTDKTTLGDALLEQNLIAGDRGEYGLYVKVVNGIEADYDKDGHFWSLCQNGTMLMTGVDTTPIKNGERYELVYAK